MRSAKRPRVVMMSPEASSRELENDFEATTDDDEEEELGFGFKLKA